MDRGGELVYGPAGQQHNLKEKIVLVDMYDKIDFTPSELWDGHATHDGPSARATYTPNWDTCGLIVLRGYRMAKYKYIPKLTDSLVPRSDSL